MGNVIGNFFYFLCILNLKKKLDIQFFKHYKYITKKFEL